MNLLRLIYRKCLLNSIFLALNFYLCPSLTFRSHPEPLPSLALWSEVWLSLSSRKFSISGTNPTLWLFPFFHSLQTPTPRTHWSCSPSLPSNITGSFGLFKNFSSNHSGPVHVWSSLPPQQQLNRKELKPEFTYHKWAPDPFSDRNFFSENIWYTSRW